MQAHEKAAAIDIAIVGMACRFPGAANYDEYWQNLVSRRNCIREVPSDRWSWQQYFGDPRVEPNKTSVKWGGFIDDIDKFDPLFFGIAPNEAAFIDPQHRLFLETAWHAVEDAGYSVGSLSGRTIGVYAGVSKNDYSESMRESRYEIAPYISTGTVHSILTNRVSFLLNLHGRSEAVDTACSSSLVALHNAIRDIASGECEAAIVGGVNALITPTMFISHSKSGMLSPDGQCKTFSAGANGYVRSEGVGVLFIKPLEHALRDGDHVHAVIKSSAINHGGRSNFLTSPTTEAQAAVVMKALDRAGIDPRTIGYIETHGTGTPLGDPIEINGLKKAFAQLSEGAPEQPYCALSAVKTNIGHLESASGMAGIIKVILAMKHRQIPGVRNFEKLNPYIELDASPFYIATETVAWEPKDQPRRAGVSSFGMGGVNAHVVLEEAPVRQTGSIEESGEHVFVLSAKKGRLKAYAESLARHLGRSGDSLRDVAFTLQTGRDQFDERLAVTASSAEELIAGLESYARGEAAANVVTGDVPATTAPAGKRIPLPTYPFARKRCWFTDVPSRMSTVAPAEPVAVNPAVRRLSTADFFIRDHVVQGKPMLPGVAHLELARAAGSAKQQVNVLKDVYWMTPVVVEGEGVEVEVRLKEDGGFELVQNDTVHSKGSLVASAAANPAKVDLRAIEARCSAGTSKRELYALLNEHGLAYGSSFQAIERYAHNDREIFAELKLPAEAQSGFVLHPSIMDGVFQTVTALSILGLKQTERQFIPFYVQSAEIVKPTASHCFVHATVNATGADEGRLLSFNATLTDAEGNVLVEIRNLQKRPIGERRETMPRGLYYRPEWRRKDVPAGPAVGTLLVIADDDTVFEGFRCENTVVVRGDVDYEQLLRKLKDSGQAPAHVAWLRGLGVRNDGDVQGALNATIYGILNFTQAAFKARLRDLTLLHVHPLGASIHAMVAGFARTLKYENPNFDYVTVGLDETASNDLARIIDTELAAAARVNALREVAYRDGQRFERTIVRDTVPAGALAPVLKQNGVYLVSGGAGGLGSVFSRHLAQKYNATILWLGRSAMTPAIAGRIREIEDAGGKAEYFSADITDREALTCVFAQIKANHPEIHGVIHAAGLIEDSFILRKQRDSFARVIEPKILGAINLDELTQNEPLDFFAVFSSIAALMPNQGQCDYAAANSFLDSFVEARNRGERPGVSLALNWPLWANGGMRVAPEEERHLLKVFGMKPLPTADGVALFETALSLASTRFPEIHQFIAIGGDQEKIERSLGVDTSAPVEAPKVGLDGQLKSIFAARLNVASESISGNRTIGELGVNSLALVGIIQDINKRFDADLKPTLLFDINTIDKLAAHLVAIGKDQIAGPARWNRSLIDVDRSDPARRTFSRTFRTAETYLRDHVVDGQYNMPGACYVEMARQAGDLLLGDKRAWRLLHNYWASPLSSPQEDFSAQVEITPKNGQYAYEVVSFGPAGEKRLHAMGEIAETNAPVEARIDLDAVQSRCSEIQYPEEIYRQIHGEGLIVGPTFQPMTHIFLNDSEALGMLVLPEEIQSTADDYVMNPALLTGAFQTSLISNRRVAGNERHYIPIGMDELEILAPIPAECCIYSRPRAGNARNEEMRKFDVEICRPNGVVVVRLKGFSIRALREATTVVEHRVAEQASSAMSTDAMLQTVQDLIKSKLASPIGVSIDEIEATVPFDQYGVTSIMVVELNQKFEEIFGPIPKTLFFEYRNVAELAGYFAENHAEVLARLAKQQEVPAGVTSSADPREDARTFLRSLIARPIGLAADEIDVYTGFDQYGVNSVMVVELNEIFENIFGPLSKTLFFEYRSVDELAGYFLEEHREKTLAALPRNEAVMPKAPEAPVRDERAEVAEVVVDDRNDIAIVSAAGRFPGARNLTEFWQLLKEGRDCITEIPEGRFDYRRYYDPDPERNGIYAKWGGFIDDVDRFDPAFFNISPREAELTDPQERLLLEVVWEMLEHAGYTRQRLHKLSDRKVGVFVGALWQPYESAGIEATLSGNVVGPSSLLYSIANRVSYFFDLSGPSMAIDTACSSSLTALHLACQSIRDGESQFAIAAGVNLSLAASKYLFLSRGRFLSTDGRCRSYGAGGDGYVPGEGVCALLLKPLSKAMADGDSILGVIKGSAINHGGRTNGYTVPNPKSQGNVIAEALQRSQIDPRAITYIDGHGTGTSLGDPVEISGLEKALGLSRDADRVCAIGSVKSNIGHLEAAAGIASITKVLLQMQHGQIAPSLHAEVLNPNIDFNRSLFRVQRELGPWPRFENTKRCAGVSSFGAGGSNAHVILEEYDGPSAPALKSTGPALFVFSARNEERLFEVVRRFDDYLGGVNPEDLHDIAYTLQLGREAMRERFAVVAGSIDELRAALASFLEKRPADNSRRGRIPGKGANADGIVKQGPQTSADWWNDKDLLQVAEAWVKGLEIDWTHLYGGRTSRFLPLPTYPFARERYWIEAEATTSAPVVHSSKAHPLLLRRASERHYASTFNGEEFFFADHLVRLDGRTFEKVLPGVASLEMARAAVERALPASSGIEMRNIVWAQPIVFRSNTQFNVALTVNGDRVDFRIYSEVDGREVLHCQGHGVRSLQTEAPRVDVERLRRQMTQRTIDTTTVYEAFVRTGGIYGPAFQGVAAIHHGADQLLADLRLPKVIANTLSDFVLHPTLMDSALQCYLGLLDDWFECTGQTRMPFALESAQVFAPCTAEMIAWMRFSPGSSISDPVVRLDIDLCDPQGRVCVRMQGFAVRAVPGASKARRNDGLMTLAPVWNAVQPEAGELTPRAGERVIVLGGNEEQHGALQQVCGVAEILQINARATVEEIAAELQGSSRIQHVVWIPPSAQPRSESEAFIADQEEGVLLGFRLIKALLQEKYGAGRLAWTVITNQTVRVDGEAVDAAHASVDGLIGSMAKEYRNWNVRQVDVEGAAWPWREMLRLPFDERGDGWSYRSGQWYRRQLAQIETQNRAGGYKRQGVYVVIGGAGGVGETLSEYLIRNYDARVIWIGRRPLDEEIAKKQARAAAAGGEQPLYISADARKREDLERALQEIKSRYGRVDGVIQSVVVLSDKGLANMPEEQFRAALSAKVDTAVRIEQVFGREPLDFILYFSSLQSYLKAPGQSNYAAGCTFTDSFAEWQSASAAYPVKVTNWGYWGSVGVATNAEHRAAMARIGWGSIEAEEGMAALEQLLSGSRRQLGLLRAVSAEAEQSMAMANAKPRVVAAPVAVAMGSGLQEQVEAWLVEAVGLLLKVKRDDVDLDAELSEFGFDSISLTGFANHVNQAHALELMPTIFFEHPTVRRFANYLVQNHGERLAEKFGAAPKRVVIASGLAEKAEAWLIEAVGVLLKVRKDDVDVDAELSEFGFDSISLTGFANHVNQAFALELMPTIFFEHPTVRRFAKYLVENHGERLNEKFGVAAAAPVAKPVAQVVTRVEKVETRQNAYEPIAIIGLSGRFPDAEDLDAFWENLSTGRDSIREIPRERWDWRALKIQEKEDGSDSGAKWGAFMDGVDMFDPLFFGISPREAERMDPQHRLTMMFGWKAFEDAGYGPKQLSGTRTGVFIGTTGTGYGDQLLTPDGSGIEGYTATGLVPSVAPNRLSYLLNLHGPSEPIETACSSSLVAVHRAVRAMEAGECEMALAGGVNTLFPTLHVSFTKAGMLSPDGRCKTFSSRANGYGRGEGVGMVVLKKLSAAERDGDHIYGVIRGSSENHGGRAQSLTAPNPNAQADLIKEAYRRAGVSPRSVGYIEAHGTGTPLGDPIEINGLKSAFQSLYEESGEKTATGYCGLGSVKTNIGHLELAAGIAGLIKILLQMKHKTLVPSIHCDEVNPYIRLEGSPFYIVRENQPWTRVQDGKGGEWPLRASVSSFGFGGVNSHIVIEEYAGRTTEPVVAGPVMIVLSARTAERLKEQAKQLQQWIVRQTPDGRDLAGIAYTLQIGREAMEHRVAMTVSSIEELAAKLGDFIEGKTAIDGLHRGEVKGNNETLALFRGDEELREAVVKWIQRGKWAKLLELWVKGLEIEWEQLYGAAKPSRVSLPTYPFASMRCWVDMTATRNTSATASVLHPLLHRNTSDFGAQRYSSTFTGEEFFLADHQVRNGHGPQKILPGVAYLEMARAAVKQASTNHESSILELRDTVWLKPVVVTEPQDVSITLSAVDDDSIDYEIHSEESAHCQGRAVYVRPPASAKLDVDQLRRQMNRGRMEASELYDMCTRMGLHYGPAHRGVTSIQLGDQQLLAELRLPAGVASSQSEFVLHPSVMDSALQASLGLFIDRNDVPVKPAVPFGIESLRIVSPSTTQMFAWVRLSKKRSAEDRAVKVDIDMCDAQGNVCVQIQGLASRVLDADVKPATHHRLPIKPDHEIEEPSTFDDAFYQSLIADIVSHKVSVDDAAELE